MATVVGWINYKGHDILFLRDPRRYRATIWEENTLNLKRRMHDKDAMRIQDRVYAWVDQQVAKPA